MKIGNMNCLSHFHFGEGNVAVQTASVYGVPALIFTHAKFGGTVGKPPHPDEPSAEDPDVMSQSVVLTFATDKQRQAVEDALMSVIPK